MNGVKEFFYRMVNDTHFLSNKQLEILLSSPCANSKNMMLIYFASKLHPKRKKNCEHYIFNEKPSSIYNKLGIDKGNFSRALNKFLDIGLFHRCKGTNIWTLGPEKDCNCFKKKSADKHKTQASNVDRFISMSENEFCNEMKECVCVDKSPVVNYRNILHEIGIEYTSNNSDEFEFEKRIKKNKSDIKQFTFDFICSWVHRNILKRVNDNEIETKHCYPTNMVSA